MLLVNRWAVGSLGLCGDRGDRGAADDRALLAAGARLQPSGQDPRLCRHFVIWDIIKANFVVARIVLFMPRRDLRPAWIVIPLNCAARGHHLAGGHHHPDPGTVGCDLSGRRARCWSIACIAPIPMPCASRSRNATRPG